MNAPAHVPVLLEAALELLRPGPGLRIVDGTFGMGGHARALLEAGAEVLGLDLDPDALAAAETLKREHPALQVQRRSFRDLPAALAAAAWPAADGLLLDLGVSSWQLDAPAKGFSYRADAPLDLRFAPDAGEPASALLARLSAAELADVLHRFGEERRARRIAREIVAARGRAPIATTGALRDAVASVVGEGPHLPATLSRVFQALRIAVNDELGALADVLAAASAHLAPGGRLVAISYHSLEDRTVKQWFARESRDCICPPRTPVCTCGHVRTLRVLTRRPLLPDALEVRDNPRARSAKLRAAERWVR